MRWRDREGSKNVKKSSPSSSNRNQQSGRQGPAGMPQIPAGMLRGLGGKGGIGIILLIVLFFILTKGGGGLGGLLGGMTENPGVHTKEPATRYEQKRDFKEGYGDPKTEEEMEHFLAVALKDTEDTWSEIFAEADMRYNPAELHIFTGYVQSACGGASKEVGPFYCSADRTIYIDMSFYNQLKDRFGATGDFTMAYVLAHEVGHHIQNELGILSDVHNKMSRMRKTEANEMSVRLELQADYLAGAVAKWQAEQGYLMEGDIEEAIKAAQAIGDDTIQKQSQGYVMPDTFTHGTSEQRMRWYALGFKYGDLEHADTFNISYEQLMGEVPFEEALLMAE